MHSGDIMFQAFVFLLAAVISVPIAKRLGMGSVLGYLIAGVVIGPYMLAIVGQDVKSIMHFAEFGVVMMLFLVGLELQPSVLWKMRTPILGLGGLQVLVTSLVFCLIGVFLGFAWQTALAIGLILSLSSTAIVLQSMTEKGEMSSEAGQSAFAVLLFQDIAVIPMLALLPLLAMGQGGAMAEATQTAHHFGLNGWQYGALVITVVAALIASGHFLVRPLFRIIAQTRLRETFTATALVLVIGIAMLMEWVGLSAALGVFIAGVVLAESEYRHELEAEIQPFKGLLLGVFFITVGASINFTVMMEHPALIIKLVVLLVVVKMVVLFGLAKLFQLQKHQKSTFIFTLAHSGEFCFVLFSFADQNNILPDSITVPLVVVVALSMAITPILMIFNEKVIHPLLVEKRVKKTVEEAPNVDEGKQAKVIIAGFGRFGQIVDRSLHLSGIETTVLETDPDQVNQLRKFDHEVFYGDLSRPELLHAAGAEHAELLVIAVNDHEKVKTIVSLCRKHYPNMRLFARATGRLEASELNLMGVDVFVRETFHSAVFMSERVLSALGTPHDEVQRVLTTFKEIDEMHVREIVDFEGDEKAYISQSQKNKVELEKVLQFDCEDIEKIQGHMIDSV
jgi:monovalent cation:proton antiporter-2 (CPA2) family protein